jgi:uncharacterized membrane protein
VSEPDPEPGRVPGTIPVAALAILGLGGLAIASYLTLTKLAGTPPVCGPLVGCETVQTSEYSELLGVPVAVYGLAYSAAVLVAAVAWLRSHARRALEVAYGLGLVGTLFVGYLTYLEIAVIGAICAWCVTYGVTVVGGWLAAFLALRATAA